jgi:integrase
MGIHRRGDTWAYRFAIKGKKYRGSCKTQDEVEARELHDTLVARAWRGELLNEKPRRTLDEAFKRFLDEHQHKRTWKADQRFANWWQQKLGVKHLDEVTADLVKTAREKHCVGVQPATVNRKLAFLRAVVNAAWREWAWVESAPKIKLLPGEKQRRRFLQPHEVHRLVAALPYPYNDCAMLAVSTGLRQANVFGLRWDQVNLQYRCATFPEQVMKNGLPFSCALNDTAVEVIVAQLGKHDEYVFRRRDGQQINGLPSKVWKAALAKAGLVDVRWHDLRHTWASLMRQAGVELSELQEMGGWESAIMVQRYAHLNVEHLVGHAKKMDGLLSMGGGAQKVRAA